MDRRFDLVDVFNDRPFSENPLAVVAEADDPSTEAMQQITRWLNLSEATFLLPPRNPAADYGVRIFTLEREMPFAGHPTLGSCHAWLRAGGQPRHASQIIQECGAARAGQPDYPELFVSRKTRLSGSCRDGIGPAKRPSRSTGMGIQIMRYPAHRMGASLSVAKPPRAEPQFVVFRR